MSFKVPHLWIEEHKIFTETGNGKKNDELALEFCDGFKDVVTIAGVDEAGRGPLAGPVVVSAVILPPYSEIEGLNDSKKLTQKKREILMPHILEQAIAYSITIIDVNTIDELNILGATHYGMRKSIMDLTVRPDIAFIDGLPLPNPPVQQINLIKGDSRSANIAAASILAKVTRDRIMVELDKEYPQYGFEKHKGYPTKEHFSRLKEYGPCLHHRKSFGPVAACLIAFDARL